MPQSPTSVNNSYNDSGLPVREYLDIVAKHIWSFMICFVIVVALGCVYTYRQPKIYQATTTIMINAEPPTIDPIDTNDSQQRYLRDTYYATQLQVLKSRNVAERVVEDLKLSDDPVFLQLDESLPADQLEEKFAKKDPIAMLLGMIQIEAVQGTRLVKIHVQHRSGVMAAKLADAIATAFSEQNSEQRMAMLNGTFEFIENQYTTHEKKLQDARDALNRFKDEHQILFSNPIQQQTLVNQQLEHLLNRRTEIEVDKLQAGYLLSEIKNIQPTLDNAQAYEILTKTDVLSKLSAQYLELKKEEEKLLATYLPSSPQVKSIREQMKLTTQTMVNTMENLRKGYQSRYDALVKLDNELLQQIKSLKAEALTLDQLKLLYEQIETQKAEQENMFDQAHKKLNEVSINKLLEVNNIRILDKAIPGKKPVSPRVFLNILISILGAFVAGVALIFILELMDQTVKNQSDIEQKARLPFLGIVPAIPKSAEKSAKISKNPYRFIISNPKSPYSECVRTLRTTLSFLLPHDRSQVLLVTSPSPMEGKTTMAINLAVASALVGQNIVVIEADLRRPRLYKAFEMSKTDGLTSVVEGKRKLEEVLQKTEIDHLDLLPCGKIPSNPSEIFYSDEFREILHQLLEKYDRVIIDSPPVTVVTDALILAQQSDGVIVVSKAGKTELPLLIRTRELLEGVNAPILGVVLNGLSSKSKSYGGYYYYYSKEYKDEEKDDE